MHLIQKQDTSMRLLNQPLTVAISAGVGPAHHAEEMSHEQLRIAGVISAVEADKGRVGGQRVQFQREGMHQAREGGLADATGAVKQRMQAARGVEYSGFRLLNGNLQPLTAADQRLKTGDDRANM